MKWTLELFELVRELYKDHTYKEISEILRKEKGFKKSPNAIRKAFKRYNESTDILKKRSPKILLLDIETNPLEAYVWGLWDNNVSLNMIKEDWSVLGWCAKWYGEDEVFYEDVKSQKNKRDDSKILKKMWELLDEADIVVGHNSDKFDIKRLSARFIQHGMKPPSSFKRIDTVKLAKKHFGFTSNKLEYLTDKLCKRYKKLKHGNFPGFSMWEQCLKDNKEAFKEMKEYNIYDVLSLEELFGIFLPWESAVLFQTYGHQDDPVCTCGNKKFKKSGFHHTPVNKYQKYKCVNCGAEYKDRKSILDKDERKTMKGKVPR